MTLHPFILDCDTGRDDALAIWCALALGLPLRAIVASYGNVGVNNVSDNTARVLAVAGQTDIPVFSGAAGPSRDHAGFRTVVVPRQKNSGNGLCNLELPPSDRLPQALTITALAAEIKAFAKKSGPLDYIITGPATNLAALCAVWGEESPGIIARVTMMGGKFGALWDQIPGADFNLLCDPYAVRAVMASGLPMRFVPMNVTWPIFLTLPALETLHGSGTVATTARDVMIVHTRHFAPEPVFRFHDPGVIMAALAPEGFMPVKLDINCEETSPDFARLTEQADGFAAELYRANPETHRQFLEKILGALGLRQA